MYIICVHTCVYVCVCVCVCGVYVCMYVCMYVCHIVCVYDLCIRSPRIHVLCICVAVNNTIYFLCTEFN